MDNRTLSISQQAGFIARMCHRHHGIGADGVLFLENTAKADFKMRIFNADGSEAEMCGNGLRCFARFLKDKGLSSNQLSVEVTDNIYPIQMDVNTVSIKMGVPAFMEWNIPLLLDDTIYPIDLIDTGVPHAVLFVENIDAWDLTKLGPRLRHHAYFQPRGANFNLFSLTNRNQQFIRIRTFERGVEQETLACGTGAAACAIAAWKRFGWTGTIEVVVRSDDRLKLTVECIEKEIRNFSMSGPANYIFSGEIPSKLVESNPHFD